MMKKSKLINKNSFLIILSSLFLLLSCDEDKEHPNVDHIEVDVKINRIDSLLFVSKSKDEIQSIINENREAFNIYLELDRLPHDSALVSILAQRTQDLNIDSFYTQCTEFFGDMHSQKVQLENLYRRIKYYFPDFEGPEINTFFTAFLTPSDIIVQQDQIVLGLEYFMGMNAMYLQNDPIYILERYYPQNLVPLFIGLGISNFFNRTERDDQSLVAEMVYYGKAQYFMEMVSPEMNLQRGLGFSDEQMDYVNKNEEKIWAYFVQNNLLFETNRIETAKYVGERPNTLEISPECPGRIARWLGYKIVKKFAQKSEISFQELMAESNAKKIFKESGYNPSL